MLVIRQSQLDALELSQYRRLAQAVLADVNASSPHAVAGLSADELRAVLDASTERCIRFGLRDVESCRTFLRLCLLVGRAFSGFPLFQRILSAAPGSAADLRILDLFIQATSEDWHDAACFDILSRYPAAESPSRAHLMPLAEHHYEAYHAAALHPDVWRLGRMEPLLTIKAVRQAVAAPDRTGLAIVDDQGSFCGALFQHAEDDGSCRLSYWIARPRWGEGLATQALTQAVTMLRTGGTAALIRLTIARCNTPSLRVAERSGFQRSNDKPGALVQFQAAV